VTSGCADVGTAASHFSQLVEIQRRPVPGFGRCWSVQCWALVTSNAQGELTALERGLRALRSVAEGKKLDVTAYAEKANRAKERRNIQNEVMAARVADALDNVFQYNCLRIT